MSMIVTVVMMRRGERASGRQKEREAQQRCLNLFAGHEVYLRLGDIARSMPLNLSNLMNLSES
jgi:hypothetical protein